jgi:tRNA uridine 5-carbamoylmethylation protein Kti12
MQERTVFKKNPDMVTRVIDDETILMPIYKTSEEINCIYTLNKDASGVWSLIDGKRTLGEIKKQVLKEFNTTPKEVDKQMCHLLKDLVEIKAMGELKNVQKAKI